jgi:plasmid stabilization system protein ParE
VKLILSQAFKDDLLQAETYYFRISAVLGERLHARVKETIRSIVRWGGGDHVGPHGFPCKRCTPFPWLIYYEKVGDDLRVLALLHERREPDTLKKRAGN